MKAVVLCAKKKDNLFPFTETKPTGLIPVKGKPAVRNLVEDLRAIGTDRVYLVVNHLQEKYMEEFQEDGDVECVVQEDVTGTADALENVDGIEDDFIVVNGDVLVSRSDLKQLKRKHLNERSLATVLGDNQDRPEKFGVLSITNDDVNSIVEKPKDAQNSLINTGVYAFRNSIFEHIEASDSSSIAEVVGAAAETEKVKMEVIDDYWMEIDSLKHVWKADSFMREKDFEDKQIADSAQVSDGAEIRGNVVIEADAVVRENSTIEGPAFIGEGSVIGPGTVIHHSTVCRNSQIRNATVESSFLFENQVVDPYVHIEQSVLGEGVDVKSGTAIAESFIGAESFIEINNSVKGAKFYPDARTDLGEISK